MTGNDILAGLESVFRVKLDDVIAACGEAGFRVVPYQGYRSPAEQACLWRQSRSRSEIEERMRLLRAAGAATIADLVEGVGPQFGPHVTNALPGESWHQFGRAADCYVQSPDTGRALWRDRKVDGDEFGLAAKLYERFGRLAESTGLTWGGRWAIGDFGHVQLDKASSPLAQFGSWRGLSLELAQMLLRGA
jgi:hypothetical protein